MRLKHGTIKRLHVDRRVVASNAKNGTVHPAVTIQTSQGPFKAMRAEILGPSSFIYSPHKPLSCGARLWVETRAEVVFE
jgi:hypothetical protein